MTLLWLSLADDGMMVVHASAGSTVISGHSFFQRAAFAA